MPDPNATPDPANPSHPGSGGPPPCPYDTPEERAAKLAAMVGGLNRGVGGGVGAGGGKGASGGVGGSKPPATFVGRTGRPGLPALPGFTAIPPGGGAAGGSSGIGFTSGTSGAPSPGNWGGPHGPNMYQHGPKPHVPRTPFDRIATGVVLGILTPGLAIAIGAATENPYLAVIVPLMLALFLTALAGQKAMSSFIITILVIIGTFITLCFGMLALVSKW